MANPFGNQHPVLPGLVVPVCRWQLGDIRRCKRSRVPCRPAAGCAPSSRRRSAGCCGGIGGEVVGVLDLPCEKTAPERAVGDKPELCCVGNPVSSRDSVQRWKEIWWSLPVVDKSVRGLHVAGQRAAISPKRGPSDGIFGTGDDIACRHLPLKIHGVVGVPSHGVGAPACRTMAVP
jgi:hypothetical protein